MKYWIRLLMLASVPVILFAIIGYLLPHGFSISTQTLIAASPEDVYAQIDTLPEWKTWSNFDPDKFKDLKIEFGEDGTSQTWSDGRGNGKLWFVDQVPNEKISYRMRYGNFPEIDSTILLEQEDGKTKVSLSSEGMLPPSPFYGFFRGLYSKGMTAQYQRSLQQLKEKIEGPANAKPDAAEKPQGAEAAPSAEAAEKPVQTEE